MFGKRRHFDRDFKLSAVKLLDNSENPLEQVARELGITGSMLRHWRNQVRSKGPGSFTEAGRQERSEVVRLRRENKKLKQELEILKKTLGFGVKVKRKGTRP